MANHARGHPACVYFRRLHDGANCHLWDAFDGVDHCAGDMPSATPNPPSKLQSPLPRGAVPAIAGRVAPRATEGAPDEHHTHKSLETLVRETEDEIRDSSNIPATSGPRAYLGLSSVVGPSSELEADRRRDTGSGHLGGDLDLESLAMAP